MKSAVPGRYFTAARLLAGALLAAAGLAAAEPPAAAPVGSIPEGRYLDYSFEHSRAPRSYHAGPLRLTISAVDRGELGLVSRVRIEAPGEKPFILEGEPEQPGWNRRLAVLKLSRDASLPAVMISSYSGGAHCCVLVRLAVPGPAGFRRVDLGEWDGDALDYPRDISGDGVPDFVVPDDAFLYTFTAYAFSEAPPRILDIVAGKPVDVSDRLAFRPLFLEAMGKAGKACRDPDPATSAGACPAFVAAAAQLGQLDQAWRDMASVVRPDPQWELPMRCRIERRGECPGGSGEERYASYGEALAALLRAEGYASADWRPPAPAPAPGP